MDEVYSKDLGIVTAYGYALSQGYTGTEEQFATLMADYATIGQQAVDAALAAEGYAVGTHDGEPVPSTDPAYHNNAKYYAEQLAPALDALAYALAAFPTATLADQQIASFDDGAGGIPAKDMSVAVVAAQAGSGEPSPDNVRPISGWTGINIRIEGKNLLPLEYPVPNTNKYVVATVDGNNVRVNNTEAATTANCGFYPACMYSYFKSGITYTLSADIVVNSGAATMGFRDAASGTFIAGGVVRNITANGHYSVTTTPTSKAFIDLLCTYTTAELGDVEYNNIQLEIGSAETATATREYSTVSVVFPDTAGTVYGGTLDATTGLLSVTHRMIVLAGSGYVGGVTARANTTRFQIYTGAADSARAPNPTAIDLSLAICDKLPSSSAIYNNDVLGLYIPRNQSAQGYADHGATIYLSVPSAAGGTADSVKAWLSTNNLTIVYRLDVPQNYQLTPAEVKTLLGPNNIFADAGNVNVTYRADPTLYINGKVAALTALISES